MNLDLSIWQLITDASPLVQGVMLALVFASIGSWTIIFQWAWYLRGLRRRADGMAQLIQRKATPTELFDAFDKLKDSEGIYPVLYTGLSAYRKSREGSHLLNFERIERLMRAKLTQSSAELQTKLPFLASVSSVSPYVGLFGTVWGIMMSMRALGSTQQATLALVAPGIAEALIATAMGLLAAIPAAIAYNRFSHAASQLSQQYEALGELFLDAMMTDASEGRL